MTHALSRGYFVMALECGIGWLSSDTVVSYRNHEITMRPETNEDAPSLVIEVTPEFNQLAARRLLQEFMSGLAWVDGGRLTESFSVFSTGAPMRVGKGPAYGGHTSDAPIEYLPDPRDPLARLALAFYREAVSLNAIPYKFLGFVKIVNILREKGPDQKAWMSQAAQHVRDHKACERRDEILAHHGDVGAYLYHSGRCAIAHAHDQSSVVNPDDPQDHIRLAADLPLIKALAEHAIEVEFGVKSARTVRDEHLYELEGFRELLSEDVLADLKAGKDVDASRFKIPERLALRLRGVEPFSSFEDLHATIAKATSGVAQLHLAREDNLFEGVVILNFRDERLYFDALEHVVLRDDGTTQATDVILDFLAFQRRWMVNGVNELYDPSTGKRLGRSAPVLLVNMRPDWDFFDTEIARVKAERESRLKKVKEEAGG